MQQKQLKKKYNWFVMRDSSLLLLGGLRMESEWSVDLLSQVLQKFTEVEAKLLQFFIGNRSNCYGLQPPGIFQLQSSCKYVLLNP